MKKLRERGDGSWEVIKLDPSAHTVEELLHDLYQSRGWADAEEAEYEAQLESVESNEPLESVE